jgi:segregation and condensation protein A
VALSSTHRIPSFDGPLDFFLERLRQQQIPIRELRLAPLVEEYLAFVRRSGRTLGEQMEWIEMAAALLRWKSRVLLSSPSEAAEQEDEELRASLIAQLLARARELAGELARRRERETHSWTLPAGETRAADPALPETEEEEPFFSAWDVLRQADELRAWVLTYREEVREREQYAYEWSADPTTIEEMSAWATERLQNAAPGAWVSADPLFTEAASVPRQCCLFLAFLEQARGGKLYLGQQEEFGTICISKAS